MEFLGLLTVAKYINKCCSTWVDPSNRKEFSTLTICVGSVNICFAFCYAGIIGSLYMITERYKESVKIAGLKDEAVTIGLKESHILIGLLSVCCLFSLISGILMCYSGVFQTHTWLRTAIYLCLFISLYNIGVSCGSIHVVFKGEGASSRKMEDYVTVGLLFGMAVAVLINAIYTTGILCLFERTLTKIDLVQETERGTGYAKWALGYVPVVGPVIKAIT